MPLLKGKSKKAFEHNVKAEMDAGKPQKQSLAIAYSMKRKAPKKMAEGGGIKVIEEMRPDLEAEEKAEGEMHDDMAMGGSLAEQIMRKKKMMAEGGEVDLSRNADEDPNMEDQLSYNALRKENYSESEGLEELDQPMDSNEHSDEIEHDKHDMVESIRHKMRMKARLR